MHIPVLLKEVIDLLNPQPNENFIDCTLGFAGHSKAILEKNRPNGRVLGIELDSEVCNKLKIKKETPKELPLSDPTGQELKVDNSRLLIVNDSYANLKEIVEREKFGPVNGILLDSGMSSWDLEQSGRGFSFQKEEPLIMSYAHNKLKVKSLRPELRPRVEKLKVANSNSEQEELTARKILNCWSEEDIAKILKEYGQERFAQNIASNVARIRKQWPIETTFQLIEVIRKSFPRSYKFGKQHFATKTFQALRIAVNNELENLKIVLPQAAEVLASGGRLVIISFHSLEDKIIKNFFKAERQKNTIKILIKKPMIASAAEIAVNPRARSAKLRAALKL